MLRILIIIVLLIVSNNSIAKSKCEREWNALKNVQSQLRHNSTEYLRDKERKKHKNYQECRKGKNKKSNSHKTKANYKKPKTTYSKNSYSTDIDLKRYRTKTKYRKSYSSNNTQNKKHKTNTFKDEKLEGWLKYYKTPQECMFPKEMTQFARCVSYRKEEKAKFNLEWIVNKNEKN